MLSVETWF